MARVTQPAFDQTQGEEVEMIARIRASPPFIPQLSLVAEESGKVVGHLFVSRETLRRSDGEPAGHAVLMLGPISVLPEVQRRGIGSRRMRRGLDIAASRPEPMVVLVRHPEYCPRFGFRPAREFGMYPTRTRRWPVRGKVT